MDADSFYNFVSLENPNTMSLFYFFVAIETEPLSLYM